MARRRGSNMRAVPSAAMLLALVAAGCGGAAPEEGNSLPDESRQCDANQVRAASRGCVSRVEIVAEGTSLSKL